MGSIFFKSGAIALVVNKNPNCITFPSIPAITTAPSSGAKRIKKLRADFTEDFDENI